MRIFAALLLFLSIATNADAGGGIWVLEVEYQAGRTTHHGYILADYWANDFEQSYLGKDKEFKEALQDKVGEDATVQIYSELIVHDYVTSTTPFPAPAFHIPIGSEQQLNMRSLTHVSLKKVWIKSDYMIEVQNNLRAADTAWFKQEHTLYYPFGDDVGCRLQVYKFGNQSSSNPTLKAFYKLYKQREDAPDQYNREKGPLMRKLTEQKIVIVELCGC